MADRSVVEAVAAVIETFGYGYQRENGSLSVNEPLPDSVSRACRVRTYGSLPPDRVHGIKGVAYTHPRIQIMVRGEPNDSVGPERDAYNLYFDIDKVRDRLIEGHNIINIDVLDYPVPFTTDGQRRRSYVFNIQVDEGII